MSIGQQLQCLRVVRVGIKGRANCSDASFGRLVFIYASPRLVRTFAFSGFERQRLPIRLNGLGEFLLLRVGNAEVRQHLEGRRILGQALIVFDNRQVRLLLSQGLVAENAGWRLLTLSPRGLRLLVRRAPRLTRQAEDDHGRADSMARFHFPILLESPGFDHTRTTGGLAPSAPSVFSAARVFPEKSHDGEHGAAEAQPNTQGRMAFGPEASAARPYRTPCHEKKRGGSCARPL